MTSHRIKIEFSFVLFISAILLCLFSKMLAEKFFVLICLFTNTQQVIIKSPTENPLLRIRFSIIIVSCVLLLLSILLYWRTKEKNHLD